MPAHIWYAILIATAALSLPVLALAFAATSSARKSNMEEQNGTGPSRISGVAGTAMAWLVILIVAVHIAFVFLFQGFGSNTILTQDGIQYLDGALFLLASACLMRSRATKVAVWTKVQSDLITGFSNAVGKTVTWLVVAMVLVQFAVVVMRYVFGVNFIALQESVLYAHGTLFMLASAYTLLQGGHVRVDIFYANLSPRGKAWVDLLGTTFFLVPLMLLILNASWDYVAISWRIHETSRESSGLQWLYLLKTVIMIFAGMMLLQGIAMAGRASLLIAGLSDEEPDQRPSMGDAS